MKTVGAIRQDRCTAPVEAAARDVAARESNKPPSVNWAEQMAVIIVELLNWSHENPLCNQRVLK